MNRFIKIQILMMILFLTVTGCGRSGSTNNTIGENNISYTVREIPFASNLGLNDNESIYIFDANGENILLEILRKEKNKNDPEGIDVVFLSDRLLIYNTEKKKITYEYKFDQECECSSGIFLEKGIAFMMISHEKDTFGQYSLYRYIDGTNTLIESGKGSSGAYSNPQLVRLGDFDFAYSYYNPDTNNFGVNTVDADFRIKKSLSLNRKENHMRSTLYSNNDDYIYFYDKSGIGWFVIGDKNGMIDKSQLKDNELINDYCLLNNMILFSLSFEGQNREESGKLFLKNYKGEVLSDKRQPPLFRMESNNKDIAVATDSSFHNHFVYLNKENKLSTHDLRLNDFLDIPVDGDPVSIHYNDDNEFILFFYGENLKLVKVDFRRK